MKQLTPQYQNKAVEMVKRVAFKHNGGHEVVTDDEDLKIMSELFAEWSSIIIPEAFEAGRKLGYDKGYYGSEYDHNPDVQEFTKTVVE